MTIGDYLQELLAKLQKNTHGHRIVRNALILYLHIEERLPLANIAEEAGVCLNTAKTVLADPDNFKRDGKLVKQYAEGCFRQEQIENVLQCLITNATAIVTSQHI